MRALIIIAALAGCRAPETELVAPIAVANWYPSGNRPCVDRETEILWRREMLAGSYVPTFAPVETPQGTIEEAVTFVINRQSSRYVQLDIEETARLIATGRGVRGTCLEYLENLADRLELLGLDDPAIRELRARVRRLLEAQAQSCR